MCIVKTPKIKPTDAGAKKPDPVVIRNPYLDGADTFSQNRKGRSQLRIDPGTDRRQSSSPAIPLPSSSSPAPARRPRASDMGSGPFFNQLGSIARRRVGIQPIT